MANYANLKAAIQAVITTNGNNEITGALLQQSLLSLIDSLGAGYQFMGIATPTTNPGTPDQRVIYLAATAGIYANFNSIVLVENEVAFLLYDTAWSKQSSDIAVTGDITVSQLTDGKYIVLSGTKIPSGTGSSSSYACALYRVYPGMKFTLKTYGTATSARAYAIGDIDRNILSVATVDGYLTYDLVIPENGAWLAVNHKKSGGVFSLKSALNQTTQDFLTASLGAKADELVAALAVERTRIDNLPVYRAMVGADLETGKYYNLTVSPPTGPYSSSSWCCAKIPVFAGQKFYLTTVGGASARAWALTDKENNRLSVADANVTLTNELITVTQDGFLYVHCSSTAANLATFQLRSANSQLWLESTIGNIIKELASDPPKSPSYKNPSFPYYKDTLRVLVLGNSYTQNSTAYLADLLANTNIDSSKLCVYNSSPSGYTIDQWIARFGDNQTYTIIRRCGNPLMIASGTMEQLVGQAWDVIVINQASDYAFDWDSYENVKEFVGKLRRYCTNPKVCIAFQMAWTHSGDGVETNYVGIVECAKRLASEIGVNYIIPVGMAVKNARGSSLQNAYNLLSDGVHLCKGVGQYIASCAFWESIIAPVMGVSVIGNITTIDVTATEISEEHAIAVTASNRGLCQLCAHWATIDMYTETDVESM